MLLAMWRSPSRGSCHPRDTLVACHHMGWVCDWFPVGVLSVVCGGGCFSCDRWLPSHRGLFFVARWFVVVSDGELSVMGFVFGSR